MKVEILPEIPFDLLWKDAIDDFFPYFILFFMPNLYKDIDWATEPVSLEQELHEIIQSEIPDSKIRETDKLVKVFLKDGTDRILFIHIEIQSFFEKDFAERMYTYCRLIMRRYNLKFITALAIFTGKKTPRKYNRYEWDCYGTSMTYKYNAYKVATQNVTDLEKSDNPFALVVLANLLTINTKNEYEKRFQFKRNLYELLKSRGYNTRMFGRLLTFMRDLMILPQNLEVEFKQYLKTTSTSKKTPMRRPPSQGTLELIDFLYEDAYGKSIEEEKKELRAQIEKERAEREFERAERERLERERAERELLERERAERERLERELLERERTERERLERERLERERLERERLERERLERERAERERLERFEHDTKSIKKLYFDKKWEVQEIADFLEVSVARVEEIIRNSNT
jgi:hypothetical protein